ncbi:MAG: M16 family metallopeptidase [Flavobacteriales bacterium]
MINYTKYSLNNGLKVILHQDKSSPIVAVNLLYNVGARDENPEKTGFAHLFEHLMFGGSVNIEDYDRVLERVGGQNNAFTSNDITNYYITLPKNNLETALWLESDRMLSLAFSEKSLEVQRQVVIEEFKQNYLNQPYGDTSLLIRELAYKKHPYRWATIGKEIEHIENATMDDVKSFFYKHYAPNNCILTISGDFDEEEVKVMIDKYFGDIPNREIAQRNLPTEPKQTEARFLEVERNVPAHMLYKAYHMVGKHHEDYPVCDLISDILSRGEASVLNMELVKNQNIFSQIDAYVGGSDDPGLFYIVGQVSDVVSLEAANTAVEKVIDTFVEASISQKQLTKVINKFEVAHVYQLSSVLHKAMELSFAELAGDAQFVNSHLEKYRSVEVSDIKRLSEEIFTKENCSTLFYKAK